jgi:hypothetical protein
MTIALPVSLLLALKAFDIPISRPLQIPLITAHFEHQLLRVAQQLIGVFATIYVKCEMKYVGRNRTQRDFPTLIYLRGRFDRVGAAARTCACPVRMRVSSPGRCRHVKEQGGMTKRGGILGCVACRCT